MKPQALWQVSIEIDPQAEEPVTNLLEQVFGRRPVVHTQVESGRTWAAVFLEAAGEWSTTRRAALHMGLALLRQAGLQLGPGTVSFRRLAAKDWAEAWKQQFHPVSIGSALLIKPSWSQRRPKPGQAVVRLDPGLSFGTGQHPTTRFCLQQIVAAKKLGGGKSFLDIGTGSGILAIAAAKLGFKPVDALDVDPEAVQTAQANARKNRVTIRVWCMDLGRLPLAPPRPYHLVCANLTAKLLTAHARRIIRQVRLGGRLVLSGVLQLEFQQVRRIYERAGCRLLLSRLGGPWQSGLFMRTGPTRRPSPKPKSRSRTGFRDRPRS